jgi:PIN domain nuclease of toxin-antitoxin system
VWELSIKQSIGKLRVDVDLRSHAIEQGFTELPVTGAHATAIRDLPFHHKDPFGRMLVAQAAVEGLTLVTADDALAAYGVPVLSAAQEGACSPARALSSRLGQLRQQS